MVDDPFALREAEKYSSPIPSREYILMHLTTNNLSMSMDELATEFQLFTFEGQDALRRRLKAMVRDGQLLKLKNSYYWPLQEVSEVYCLLVQDEDKAYWACPDDDSEPIKLNKATQLQVTEGDYAWVLTPTAVMGATQFREGWIARFDQAEYTLIGQITYINLEQQRAMMLPYKVSSSDECLIPLDGQSCDLNVGDFVLTRLQKFDLVQNKYRVEIIESLGYTATVHFMIDVCLKAHHIEDSFSSIVQQEVACLPSEVAESDKVSRKDLRNLPFVTIDGEDAKDFDDAVYAQAKSRGGWRLYVAIADVSAYVREQTALDATAKERGNSIYFPKKVIPMLPEKLSNGLCSLKPEVDRLCLVCELDISGNGKLTKYDFYEAVICSHARLTYKKVSHFLLDPTQTQALFPLKQELMTLQDLFVALYKSRTERGAIEFETKESKIIFNKKGQIQKIELVTRTIAHRIIEECMLCANVAAARFLNKHSPIGIYRIHERPTQERLKELSEFLWQLGIKPEFGKNVKTIDFAKIFTQVKGKSNDQIIQNQLLRVMNQALYSTNKQVGHFGLAYSCYTHFTSPIRRYPDLIAHRLIKAALLKRSPCMTSAQLEAITEHTSMTERRADDVSRDVIKWLKCEYISKYIGEMYTAVISGVTHFGFFAEITELGIDGLVHISNLGSEYFSFEPATYTLIGESSGISYHLGDEVTVIVARVDAHNRKIDLELVQEQQYTKKKKKKRGLRDKKK